MKRTMMVKTRRSRSFVWRSRSFPWRSRSYAWMVPALLVLGIVLAGCAGKSADSTADMAIPAGTSTAPAVADYTPNNAEEGSLWTDAKGSMFEDTKANYVGDTVIVDIVENASSRMDVNTETSRNTRMRVGVPTLNAFGYKTNLGGGDGANLIGTDFSNDFQGEAESDRSGQVTSNRVQSTFLADSRIEYYGKGALADKQQPGWGNRLIDNLWPF
ncbi:MAG: flagellar basal body L-ring protein FlgH [Desulfobacteraceae bacterium]|nr:flagellar basal body L-ring protein FlgH [Desulfobacteraceae bacterium]